MTSKFIDNGVSLFADESRSMMAKSENLQFIDVQMIKEDVRLHARFVKEEK